MNDHFDQWLRESMPERTEDRVRSEVQLAVLKERIRSRQAQRRRSQYRFAMITIPVVLVMLISTNYVDLGGDSLDLVEVDGSGAPGGAVKNDFRSEGFNTLGFQSEEEIQEFNQQLAAGEGKVVGLEGWEIFGKTKWTIQREFMVNGKIVPTGSSPIDPSPDIPPDFVRFILGDWRTFETGIKSGEIPATGIVTKSLDGIDFQTKYWEIPTGQFGMVTYYYGQPIQ